MGKEYIEREAAIEAVKKERNYTGKFTFEEEHAWAVGFQQGITFALSDIATIPAADVLPRDEGIKLGAELAAMHGATPEQQQLEEAYLKGVEYGMTRRDVRPVVLCRDCKHWTRIKKDCILASCDLDALVQCEDFYCANGEKREKS